MKTITVTTAQKVDIDFELATLMDRILSFIIDMILYAVLLYFLFVTFAMLGYGYTTESNYYFFLIMFPIYTFYTFYWEYFTKGRSPGKIALGLRVVKENGELPTVTNYLSRWLFRLVDIWLSSGFIAAVFVASSENSQRLGEVVSGTVTIKVRPRYSFSLKDILKIGANNIDYKAQYPQVSNLAEDDMLVIKQTLERLAVANNTASKGALRQLVEKMRSVLEIEEKIQPQGYKAFLERLIKDYIMLTR